MYLQKTITAMSRKQHIQLFAFPDNKVENYQTKCTKIKCQTNSAYPGLYKLTFHTLVVKIPPFDEVIWHNVSK